MSRVVSRAVTRTWYRIALVAPNGVPTLALAQGEHLGAAIAAAEQHVSGSFAVAADVATGDDIPLGESVGKQHVVALGAVPDPAALPTFHWPSGALPQLGHAEGALGVMRGYVVRPDPELLVIEAQTDGDHLVDLFLGLLERLPSADNLEIRVLDHFEEASTTDVWLTSRVNAKKILRFLDDHDVELLANGHVEISIYVRAHRATLRLTEHKTVVWIADDRELEADVIRWFRELGVPPVDKLVTLTAVPHFHYRPAKSRDRQKLSDQLYRQRLRRVDKLPRDTAG